MTILQHRELCALSTLHVMHTQGTCRKAWRSCVSADGKACGPLAAAAVVSRGLCRRVELHPMLLCLQVDMQTDRAQQVYRRVMERYPNNGKLIK